MVDALRRVPLYLRLRESRDVLLDAIDLYLKATAEHGEDTQAAVFERIIARLGAEDRELAIQTFVRDPSGREQVVECERCAGSADPNTRRAKAEPTRSASDEEGSKRGPASG